MAGLDHDTAGFAGLAEAQRDQIAFDRKGLTESASVVSANDEKREHDEAHAGLEFPTAEERAVLRRVADSIPWPTYRA
jgi:POT family proton-dependent oligopeptide transporter